MRGREAVQPGIDRQHHVGQPQVGEREHDGGQPVAGAGAEGRLHDAAGLEHGPPRVGLDEVGRPEWDEHESHRDPAEPGRHDPRHEPRERDGDEDAEHGDERGDEDGAPDDPEVGRGEHLAVVLQRDVAHDGTGERVGGEERGDEDRGESAEVGHTEPREGRGEQSGGELLPHRRPPFARSCGPAGCGRVGRADLPGPRLVTRARQLDQLLRTSVQALVQAA